MSKSENFGDGGELVGDTELEEIALRLKDAAANVELISMLRNDIDRDLTRALACNDLVDRITSTDSADGGRRIGDKRLVQATRDGLSHFDDMEIMTLLNSPSDLRRLSDLISERIADGKTNKWWKDAYVAEGDRLIKATGQETFYAGLIRRAEREWRKGSE